nr:site-specific integrase [uncultured Roseateles sp.]
MGISVDMLLAVLEGDTYEAIAERFAVTRTAVERRVKAMAIQLCQTVGVEGLNVDGAAYVQRLRQSRDNIIAALRNFDPNVKGERPPPRVVSTEEIVAAARRVGTRSDHPRHDVSLFYILFATGARPLEVARLEVRDYLSEDGGIRGTSEVRADVAITGKPRPLFFTSTRLNDALALYLAERLADGLGLGEPHAYRGLDPRSRLFLSTTGEGFRITPYGQAGQRRFLCRPILETYRKLFRLADLRGVTPLSVRHTVVARLYERGADEDQIGLLMGIGDRSAVRQQFPRPRPPISDLVDELV